MSGKRRDAFVSTCLGRFLAFSLLFAFSEPAMSQTTSHSPMRKAILNRDLSEVKRLVAAGEDIEQPLFRRGTAAIHAAASANWDIVLFLLRSGADPAAKDTGGLTVAALARGSRLDPAAPEYRDLEAVRAILRERGLY